MKKNRSKFVALVTGFISILICITYLVLITVLDSRTFINDQITSLYDDLGVIFLGIDNLF